MMNSIFLEEVTATRLSHDLIGNIGAVNNAVELFSECDEGDDIEDIKNILDFSAKVLSKRLKFFRVCFGLSNAAVKSIDELYEICADYLSTLGNPERPIKLKMEIETPKIHKIIMPAVMMMADVIIKGGVLEVKQNASGVKVMAMSDFALDEAKLAHIDLILNGNEVKENPSAYAPLYFMMAYLKGSDVEVKRDKNTLVIGD
ncbi:MAG: hypothetical protein J6B00_01410 [Alphaproteobacteria bacterium]|nr:hypothetical protein [Alphaproteobacteria bacterium]